MSIFLLQTPKKMATTKSFTTTTTSRTKHLILSLLFLSLLFLFFISSNLKPKQHHHQTTLHLHQNNGGTKFHSSSSSSLIQNPKWLDIVSKETKGGRKKIKVGFVNVDDDEKKSYEEIQEKVFVHFDHVNMTTKWADFFPEWIDEYHKWGPPMCPKIPMPKFEDYRRLDVVVARVPCGSLKKGKGVRDVFRLQVNLVVANLLVNDMKQHDQTVVNDLDVDRTVYVVFIGSCGPMLEIFRCDDLLWHEGDYWVYKPDLRRLKQKVVMPFGSCQIAPPYAQPGKEEWRKFMTKTTKSSREAYVTLLHSSEKYVCGAIALAQSIIRSGSTKDLVLLVDESISTRSLQGLRTAGWKIKHIERIRSPYAEKDAYNEWNYSKLRLWQLTKYDKVIFIDADLIVLKNMDDYFVYPQLSAVGNDKDLFNSGVMLVEPSQCMFKKLMAKRYEIVSYNGGDQGFLNEVFTWWHRWPSKLNYLKIFERMKSPKHEIQKNLYAIHYLGLKPWMCYRDYDCNWDMVDHHIFASDMAHRRWWQVYDAMPKSLQRHCALTKHMDARIKKWRGRAENASLADGHWKIKVKDPRRHYSV